LKGARNRSFLDVTEQPGEPVTSEQVARLCSRYHWARGYCAGKDVLEIACGTGIGLPYIAKAARSVKAGDASEEVYAILKQRLGERFEIRRFPAERIPYPDGSFDVVILFEAIYYLESPEAFVRECKRVLRAGGTVLVSTANKDLFDFTPSLFAKVYYGVVELASLFGGAGFAVEFFGDSPVAQASVAQRVLRLVKMAATKLRLIPKTMRGKRLLKRLVFGRLQPMPQAIDESRIPDTNFTRLRMERPDRDHKVIFCAARLP